MAKKQKIEDPNVILIRSSIEQGNAILGTKRTLKLLKAGNIASVYTTYNAPSYVQEDIKQYCKIAGVECITLDKSNEELGVICKKPFHVSMLSIKK